MSPLDQVLGEFIDAWNAGRRPDVDAFLARVPEAERDELAARIATWLELAPTPAYDAAARAAIAREPELLAARAAAAEERAPLAERLPVLRARAGLSVAELAARVVAVFGLDDQARAARHLTDLERGTLAPHRLSNRLLDALRAILGADLERGGAVAAAPAFASPAAAAPPPAPARVAFRTAAPEPMDELDRLFLGGPYG